MKKMKICEIFIIYNFLLMLCGLKQKEYGNFHTLLAVEYFRKTDKDARYIRSWGKESCGFLPEMCSGCIQYHQNQRRGQFP